jgi:hypothetical protein
MITMLDRITEQDIYITIFSVLGAFFLIRSALEKSKKELLRYQICDCAMNILVGMVAFSFSGIVMNTFALLRNGAVFRYEKIASSKTVVGITTLLAIGLGTLFNNNGAWGLLPIIAVAEYTLIVMISKNVRVIKVGLILNCLLWCIYHFYIKSFPMGFGLLLVMAITTFSLFQKDIIPESDSIDKVSSSFEEFEDKLFSAE